MLDQSKKAAIAAEKVVTLQQEVLALEKQLKSRDEEAAEEVNENAMCFWSDDTAAIEVSVVLPSKGAHRRTSPRIRLYRRSLSIRLPVIRWIAVHSTS